MGINSGQPKWAMRGRTAQHIEVAPIASDEGFTGAESRPIGLRRSGVSGFCQSLPKPPGRSP